MKKILVVGANSFLGREIIERSRKNNNVTGVYNNSQSNLCTDINNIHISRIEELQDDFDIVYLVSAYVPEKSHCLDLQNEHLRKSNILLPQLVSSSFPKAKIVFASSVSVYGSYTGKIKEDTICVPLSDYGKSKLEGERIISKHQSYSIIRIASMYGKGMKQSTFLPLIISCALQHKKVQLYGDGKRLQNYIHVSDVAEIFERSAQEFANNTYLAVAEKSYSNLEIASIVKKMIGNVNLSFTGHDESPSFIYDGSLTWKKLNYIPVVNIENGISELIEWKRKLS